ncbi:MAG: hypothetical protein WCP09_00565, partial [Candidatus Taylorbacteria bacterium]
GGGMGGGPIPVKIVETHLDEMTQTRKNQDFQKQKECSLDGLAWAVGADLLRSMSDSVIQWINGGFDGKPAFMQNPQAFFMDQADQLTGAFIAGDGPLQGLCGSFGLDIKLSLAQGQAHTPRERYTCTLSSIIQNASNAHISMSVDSDPNGATLGDFVSGGILSNSNQLNVNGNSVNSIRSNFTKTSFSNGGGWRGFLELTTQPQNSPIGAYILTKSDLQEQIANSKQNTNSELDRGKGFFSWKTCEPAWDAYGQTADYCEIQTPGSVIGGALDKTLGASQDRLNAAHELNEIIDAFFNQLVTTTLKKGLGTMTLKPPGATQSALSELSAQGAASSGASTAATLQQMSSSVGTYVQPMTDLKSFKDQVLLVLETEQQYANEVLVACENSANMSQDAVDGLNTLIDGTITPIVNVAQTEATDAATRLTTIKDMQTAVQAKDTQTSSTLYARIVGSNYLPSIEEIQTANTNIGLATTTANTWRIKTNEFGIQCGLSSNDPNE